MKTFKNLVLALISIVLFFACEPDREELFQGMEKQQANDLIKSEYRGKRVIPLNASMVTTLTPTDETGNCNTPYVFFNNQEGQGTIANIGNIKTKITFCVNPNTFEYVDGQGTIFMDNGDRLYFTVEGQVLPSDHPDYDFEFQDPFYFTGGTGRFKGAGGGGRTNSLVKFFPEGGDQTDHKLKGIIILPGNPN